MKGVRTVQASYQNLSIAGGFLCAILFVPSCAELITLPPGTRGVILNIGSNEDPKLVPPSHDAGGRVVTVAVEPDVFTIERLLQRKENRAALLRGDLMVIPGAVSSETGFATLSVMNSGLSSSLGAATEQHTYASWARTDAERPVTLPVPTFTLGALIDAIPAHVPIVFLLTDMQGYDYTGLLSAEQRHLQRVVYYQAECELCGRHQYRDNVGHNKVNDCFLQHAPYLASKGFETLDPEVLHMASKMVEKQHYYVPDTATGGDKWCGANEGNWADVSYVNPTALNATPWFTPWPGMMPGASDRFETFRRQLGWPEHYAVSQFFPPDGIRSAGFRNPGQGINVRESHMKNASYNVQQAPAL